MGKKTPLQVDADLRFNVKVLGCKIEAKGKLKFRKATKEDDTASYIDLQPVESKRIGSKGDVSKE